MSKTLLFIRKNDHVYTNVLFFSVVTGIRTFLLESEEHECPDCNEKDVSPETLIPNRFLRNAVMNFKNETGYAKRQTYRPPLQTAGQPSSAVPTEQPKVEAQQTASQVSPQSTSSVPSAPSQEPADPPQSANVESTSQPQAPVASGSSQPQTPSSKCFSIHIIFVIVPMYIIYNSTRNK